MFYVQLIQYIMLSNILVVYHRSRKLLYFLSMFFIISIYFILGTGDIWKVHFIVPNWLPGTEKCFYVCQCYGSFVTELETPLMYNLRTDPGEKRECTQTNPCGSRSYDEVLSVITQATEEFSNSLEEVESQYAWYNFIPRPWLQPCCNFPYCSCTEEDES